MDIVLAKGKLVKLFKSSTVLQEVIENRLSNSKVCSAEYFGYKIHYAQNKKLGMYGAVHVCAKDGYSDMIVEFAAMPTKLFNNARPDLSVNFLTFLLTFILLLLHFYYTFIGLAI